MPTDHRAQWPHVASTMLNVCAVVAALVLIADVLAPAEFKESVIAAGFSEDGVVSPEGRAIIAKLLTAARATLLVGVVVTFTLHRMTLRAERRVMASHLANSAPSGWPCIGHRELWIVAIFFLLRLALSLKNAGLSLHHDEMLTLEMYSGLSPGAVLGFSRLRMDPNNHVLNTLLVGLSVRMGSISVVGIRAWSVISSALVVPAAWALARTIGIRHVASLAVTLGLVATSPVLGSYGHLARGYVHAVLFATISVTCFLQLLNGYRWSFLVGLLLSNVLLILSCATAAILPAIEAGSLLAAALMTTQHPAGGRTESFSATMATLILSAIAGIAIQFPLFMQLVWTAYDQTLVVERTIFHQGSGPLDRFISTLLCSTLAEHSTLAPIDTAGVIAPTAAAVNAVLLAGIFLAFIHHFLELRRTWPFASRQLCVCAIASAAVALAASGFPLLRSNTFSVAIVIAFAMASFERMMCAEYACRPHRWLTRGAIAVGALLVLGQFVFDRLRSVENDHRRFVLSILDSADRRVWGDSSNCFLSALCRTEPERFRQLTITDSPPKEPSIYLFNSIACKNRPGSLPNSRVVGKYGYWVVYQVD